jgi:hypothetical protein
MKRSSLAAILLSAAGLASAPVHAQSNVTVTAAADVEIVVPINAYLNLSSSNISIPQPTAADVAAGISKPAIVTMSYGSNGTIALGYQFTGGSFMTGTGGNQVAIGALRLSMDGGPNEQMAEFNHTWRGGIAPGDYTESLAIALALNWSVKPDQYSAPWEVILVAN